MGGYLGLIAAWMYAGHDLPSTGLALLSLTGLATFAIDALIGRWWACVAPSAAIAIAIPADFDPEVPTWFDIALFFVPPAIVVIGVGVAAAKLRKRRARRV